MRALDKSFLVFVSEKLSEKLSRKPSVRGIRILPEERNNPINTIVQSISIFKEFAVDLKRGQDEKISIGRVVPRLKYPEISKSFRHTGERPLRTSASLSCGSPNEEQICQRVSRR